MHMDSVEISTSTKLVVKGVLIASIFRTTTTYTCVKSVMDLISVGQVHFRDWLKTFAIFQDKFARKELLSDLFEVIEIFTADASGREITRKKIFEYVEFLRAKDVDPRKVNMFDSKAMTDFCKVGNDSKLFATDQMHLGRAFGAAQEGDKLVLIAGSDLPLVFRRDGENWRYIFSAYVAGIMEGEAWPQDKGVCEMETFVLV
ncbi:hypothetical protein BS50DRAFT_134816 [Corynespora cassiicola Philippines]|uniref:Uncharacterized protein n=1 Tax=Corynespora cassiicola Philippines TaxID=1448308 RepID=A0A2T2N990_CORCC|nr:hypothetical protein BS50DRAFT_134816 [Corynespora cassiicola Philippines]